ncbi:MAG TPA: hypothetical protein VLG50_03355 [Candidatus Saccharimonadales bacterium]|nr:hypothetical protein [Candidatus Saccharimonadales bacterium]
MKLKYFYITLLIAITSSKQIKSDLFLSAQLAPEHVQGVKHLMDSVGSYPLTTVMSDGTVQQGMQNRKIKAMTPPKTWPILAHGNFTVLKPDPTAFQTYPSGSIIFPGYPDIAQKFDDMIENMKNNPEFIPFFRKVHINILNELYHYLMSIYTNFNLQHVGIKQNEKTGKIYISIPQFLNDEVLYDANKKTLIINHLINIIESQFNGAIRSYIRKIPQTFASFMGTTLIQNDYSIDLTQFLIKQIEPELKDYKQKYLKALASYLEFYQLYTSYLNKPHPKQKEFTAFVAIAEDINQFIYGDNFTDTAANKEIIAVQKMDPPLFYFEYDTMRALKIIPHLAKKLSANSQNIMWPEHIIDLANLGGVIDGHPMAYFRDDDDTVVQYSKKDIQEAKYPSNRLFICMQSGANSFEEQLIAQPDWLNSWDGVNNILRACFGDFSALLGLNILDPCMESLVKCVVVTQNGQDVNESDIVSPACKTLIESLKKEATKPTIPSLPVIPLTPNLLGPQQHPANSSIYTQSNLIPTAADIMQQGGQ